MSAVTDIASVKTALRKWVELALVGTAAEGHAVLSRQGGPRPARPYAMVGIDSVQMRGRDEKRDIDAAGERDVVGPRVVTATVQVFGANALGLAEGLRATLTLDAVRALLRSEGVSFLAAEAVQDITIALETDFEERAAFEVRVAYASSQTESVGWIAHVEVAGRYRDPSGTTIIDDGFWEPDSPA